MGTKIHCPRRARALYRSNKDEELREEKEHLQIFKASNEKFHERLILCSYSHSLNQFTVKKSS